MSWFKTFDISQKKVLIHNNPEAEDKGVTRMPRWMTRHRESETPLGCERKTPKSWKETSSVLSVLLLIYGKMLRWSEYLTYY